MKIHLNPERALPVFLGALGSLVISALVSVNSPGLLGCYAPPAADIVAEEKPVENEPSLLLAEAQDENHGRILEMYAGPDTQEQVIDFFAVICGSRDIAGTILAGAAANDIPPALAFALGWEESRFNPDAINLKNRNGSIDRGLFQLNNRSFPKLDSRAFFDPAVNTANGMSHLRFCLDAGGTEIAALAIYNAGSGRVGSTGTPRSTLDYIHRIIRNRQRIEAHFEMQFVDQAETLTDESSPFLAAAEKKDRSRFVPLLPLTGPAGKL